jgi:hypothetical protein
MENQPQKPKPFKPSKKKPRPLKRPLPPWKSCVECGKKIRSWSKNPLCRVCTKEIVEGLQSPERESLRDFRKRLKDG